jgi:hypothetical protein
LLVKVLNAHQRFDRLKCPSASLKPIPVKQAISDLSEEYIALLEEQIFAIT